MLLAGVGSKFVPVIVTVVPMAPLVGVKALMVGTANIVLRKTDTVLLVALATTKSAFPSPSKSPIETERALDPVTKSTLGA